MTLGSCDSSRIAQPGRRKAPRLGLLLGLLGVAVGAVAGCVDQPLIPVERPASGGSANGGAATGGESNTTVGPHNGGNGNGLGGGGWVGAGGNGTGGGQSGFGGQQGVCIAKSGASCSDHELCCDGLLCNDGWCCTDLYRFCKVPGDCCSNTCSNNACVPAPVNCTAADYTTYCNSDGNCCSRNCIQTTRVCAPIEGCKPIGEHCQKWWDCCSGTCNVQNGVGHCGPNPNGGNCGSVGEVCDNENSQSTCCGGFWCKRSIEGIARCAVRGSSSCAPPGDACRVASDCCAVDAGETTGHCLVNGQEPALSSGKYYGTCSACGGDRRPCKVDADCCIGQNYECNLATLTCEYVGP